MTTIYTAPPWRLKSSTPGLIQPIRQSRGIFSGTVLPSSAGPTRRTLAIEVSSLAGDRDGAGLSESLKRLLDGGLNLVRVPVPPINWIRDAGQPVHDLAGAGWVATVTTRNGFDALRLTGRIPGAVVCRAYDLIGVYVAGVLSGSARAVATVKAGIDGVAVIPLFDPLPAGVVRVGESEAMVARATRIPEAAQPLSGDWIYSWAFEEFLPGDSPDDAEEVNPWG